MLGKSLFILYLYFAGFSVKYKFCVAEKETLMKKGGAAEGGAAGLVNVFWGKK